MRVRPWNSHLVGLLGVALGACTGDAAPAGDAALTVDGAGALDGGADGAVGGGVLLGEDFGTGTVAAWPAGWSVLGGVASATVEDGRGRLVPVVSTYTLARMGHPLPVGTVDVEVAFTLAMAEPGRQGVGFYVRQNGGYLRASPTPGAGYAVFVEGFRGPQIGVWRERDGVEEPVRMVTVPAFAAGVIYAVRFRCTQSGGETALAAKVWPAGAAEPSGWNVTATDTTAALQGAMGGVAIDAWNTATPGAGGPPGAIFIDDLAVSAP